MGPEFTIQIAGGSGLTFAERCIIAGTCQMESGTVGQDAVVFRTLLEVEEDLGELVEIYRDATLWFRGALASKNKVAAVPETWEIRIESPLPYWLKRVTYKQPYAYAAEINAGATVDDPSEVVGKYQYRSDVMLGINSETGGAGWDVPLMQGELVVGNEIGTGAISTGEQIRQICRYAIQIVPAEWKPYLELSTAFARNFPTMQATDQSCWECILQVLKWHPDALILNSAAGACTVIGKASSGALALPAECLEIISEQERSDLAIPAVEVIFPITATVDGAEVHEQITRQVYPVDADVLVPAVLSFTIRLRGPGVSHQKQAIVSKTIPDVGDNDAAAVAWIKAHVEALKDIVSADIKIGQASFTQVVTKPEGAPVDYPDEFPNELLSGTVPEWLDPDREKAAPVTISLYLSYVGTDAKLRQLFAPTGKLEFKVQVTGTTLKTRTYSKPFGFEEGEAVPAGLAQAFYESIDQESKSGTARLAWGAGGAAAAGFRAGRKLTDRGLLQRVIEDATTGRIELEYGPYPRDLGPLEWIELQRQMTRTIHLSYAGKEKRSATLLSNKRAIEGNNLAPLKAAAIDPRKPTGSFSVERSGSGQVWCQGGRVHFTAWAGDVTTNPGDKITVAAGSLTGAIGRLIYCQINYTKTVENIDLDLERTRKDLTWSGAVNCTDGGSGSGSGSGDCGCTCTVTGTINPSYIYEATKAVAERHYWTPTSASLVSVTSAPVDTETQVHILLATVITAEAGDPAEMWTVRQEHIGDIWAAVPFTIVNPPATGGVGP